MPSQTRSTFILKSVLAPALLALALAPVAASASILRIATPVHAAFGNKTKTVGFKLHNDSAAPLELRAGDQVLTLTAGQTLDVHLAAGTRVLTTAKSGNREAGTLICEVSSALGGSTITLR